MKRRGAARRIATGAAAVLALLVLAPAFGPLPPALLDPPWARALFAHDGTLLQVRIAADEQWRLPLPQARVPPRYATALLAYEDRRFYWHPGIDPLAIARAALRNLRQGRVVSGGSTLTMQLARLAHGRAPRTLWQKLREAWLALRIEWRFGKPEILALYATHAPFGGNVVGLHAASRIWFGRAPDTLSWAEAAMLAVLPNNPALVHPGRNRERLQARRDALLRRLHAAGALTVTDLQLALREAVPEQRQPWPRLAPHLLARLAAAAPSQPLLYSMLDAGLQQDVQRLVAQQAPALARDGVRNAAVVVIDHVRLRTVAYIGNHAADPASGAHVDIAARPRSTGSILKPLLYAAMLHDGELAPTQLVADVPGNFAGYAPQNVDRDYRGAVPAYQVLAQSLNVPSVRLLQRYGVARFRHRLQQFGLGGITRSADHYGLALILGGAEASLWELAGVYANLAAVAASGASPAQRRPVALLAQASLPPPAPFPVGPGAAWLTLQAMTDVVRPGGDMFWRDYSGSQVIAWKTGTSFGHRDGWAIGSNGHYTVAVWVGNADGAPAATLGGAQSAGPVLLQVFARLGRSDWIARPLTGLRQVTVCADDGYLADGSCPVRRVTVPAESRFARTTPWHRRLFLTADGRFRVHAGCERPARMQARDWFVLPPGIEHFYRRQHADYAPLPPWRPDCIATLNQYGDERAFDLLYPDADSELFIPLGLDGRLGRAVFRAVHRDAAARLDWHLDGAYLGRTQLFHEQHIVAGPGVHRVVVVDGAGQRIERRFTVVDPRLPDQRSTHSQRMGSPKSS